MVHAYPDVLRRCERAIKELDVPPPFRVADMISLAQLAQRRPIRLVQLPDDARQTGVLLDLGTSALICVDRHLPALLQRHVIAHQLGHLMLGHRLERTANGHGIAVLDHAVFEVHADGEPARWVRRCHLDHRVEYEAELFATLMLSGLQLGEPPATRVRGPGPVSRAKAAFARGYALAGA